MRHEARAHASHTEPERRCRNCDTPAPLAYCPACGQATAEHPPTLWEFLHEFIGHYVALEGKLWQSLKLLLLRPGALTVAYWKGRKARYVLPLRIYLSASFIFFVALRLFGSAQPVEWRDQVVMDTPAARSAVAPGARESDEERRRALAAEFGCNGPEGCNVLQRAMMRAATLSGSQEAVQAFVSRVLGAAPYVAFLMVPVFAAMLKGLYRSRRRLYGEHLVFAFHLHAFAFLALGVGLLPAPAGQLVAVAVPLYALLALRRAYGGRWWATAARAVLLALCYGLLLAAVALCVVVAMLVR